MTNVSPHARRFAALGALIALASGAPEARAGAFESCLAGLRPVALRDGVSGATYDKAIAGLQPNPEVFDLARAQPEFKTPIWDYLAGLVDEERVADGRAMMAKYANALAAAERRFGVDAPTIVAVWGVESNFGRAFGARPLIQSLATLSCGDYRAAYFRTEFLAALKIIDRGDVAQADLVGSWAGAFGHTQFMPSTFLRTAVDMDGDGRRDLVNSVPDALGSTAAYLKKSGWTTGQRWGFEVRLPQGYAGPSGRKGRQPMEHWSARGITRIDGAPLGGGSAALLLPAGPNGPAFLVTKNFDAIFSYNAAESYALAIALLSDRLRGGRGIVAAWPTNDPGLSRADRRELQTLLMRRGYDLDGKADGVIGTKTKQAIVDFQRRAGMAADGRASLSVLTAARGR